MDTDSDLNNLKNRTVLMVGAEPNKMIEINEKFTSLGCHVIQVLEKDVLSPSGLIQLLHENSKAEVLILDAGNNSVRALGIVSDLNSRILTEIKSRIGIFVIFDQIATGLNEMYFAGAEAVFIRPFNSVDFAQRVGQIFNVNFPIRKTMRVPIAGARVLYSSTTSYALGFATNLSLDGMFIGSVDDLPPVNEKILFDVKIHNDPGYQIAGTGVVKWIRSEPSNGNPRGFGIKFDPLEQLAFLELNKVVSGTHSVSNQTAY